MEKERKLLTEGANNFAVPPKGLPLLVGMTLDEYEDLNAYYNSESDEEYEPDVAVLDEYEIDNMKEEINDFIIKLLDYNEEKYDYDDMESTYFNNKYAIKDGSDVLISIEPGYYDGFQVYVRDDYEYLSPELKGWVLSFLYDLQKKYGLTQINAVTLSDGTQMISNESDDYVNLDECKNKKEESVSKHKKINSKENEKFYNRLRTYKK